MGADVKELLDGLDYSVETLPADIISHPQRFMRAAQYRVDCLRAVSAAKAAVTVGKAEAAERCRMAKGKVTVAAVKDFVDGDPLVQALVGEANSAVEREKYAQYLVDAYRQRSSLLKSLVSLCGADHALESRFMQDEVERAGIKVLKRKAASDFR